MPMGKGTYGSQVGRPKKSMLTKKQKTLPAALKKKITATNTSITCVNVMRTILITIVLHNNRFMKMPHSNNKLPVLLHSMSS